MSSENSTGGILGILRNQVLFVLIAFVSGIISLISIFIPFGRIEVFGEGKSFNLLRPFGETGDGIIYIALILVALALLFFRKRLWAMVVSALLFILNIITYVRISSMKSELGLLAGMFKYKFGAYLLTISIIALVVSMIILYLNEKKKI